MGFSGGQFSLLRAWTGAALALALLAGAIGSTTGLGLLLGFAGATAAVSLSIGLSAPIAGLAAAAAGLATPLAGGGALSPALALLAALAFLFAQAPARPHLSWERRGDPDPGCDWRLPDWWSSAVWVAVSIAGGFGALGRLGALDGPAAGIGVLLGVATPIAAFALAGRRRELWCVLVVAELSGIGPGLGAGLAAAFDPRWIPSLPSAGRAWVFYDGGCALCHASVRFLLAEDPEGRLFRHAPLFGARFEAELEPDQKRDVPDSVLVLDDAGRLHARSAGAIFVGRHLGGLWRAAATLLAALPRRVGDRAYDAIAARRYAWFGTRDDACPLLPPELRDRFDLKGISD